MAKRKDFWSCTKVRRMLVEYGTFNMATGESKKGKKEWVVQACGTPLFSADERKTGICRSCQSGWKHPHNYPADEPQPRQEVAP